MTGVRAVEVSSDDAGIRLDRWFRRHYPELAHGRLEKLARTGQIRVDGRRVKTSSRLEAGQVVRVPPFGAGAERHDRPRPEANALDARTAAAAREMVLYRDDSVLVLNKPAGLAVQGGSGVTHHVDALLDALRFDSDERPRLAHRLDRDTSGVLVLGRTAAATARLAAAFRGKTARKTYWALTAGVPRLRRGRIDLALAKTRIGGEERVRPDAEAGRPAVTFYEVVQRAGRKVAWLALMPQTGRTHQLRVHCAALAMPILGDRKYGGGPVSAAGLPDFGGLMLHARAIEMPHPAGGMLTVSAPLPAAMEEAWSFFGFDVHDAADAFAGLEI